MLTEGCGRSEVASLTIPEKKTPKMKTTQKRKASPKLKTP